MHTNAFGDKQITARSRIDVSRLLAGVLAVCRRSSASCAPTCFQMNSVTHMDRAYHKYRVAKTHRMP